MRRGEPTGYCARCGALQLDIRAIRATLADGMRVAAEPIPPGASDPDLDRALRLGRLLGVALATIERLACHAGDCATEKA